MPLKQYRCGICKRGAPRAYLREGKFKERMDWLRRHYKRMHPKAFRSWYK